jgi:dTDP-4-amino-4,6-dideoxygalactose transaminase
MKHLPFNKPHLTGKETQYIHEAVATGKISGNGVFTKKCQEWLCDQTGSGKVLLTTSCTDALEMAAILADIQPGDEVIMPSFTFVSTANAFILRGAQIVFIDSRQDHPGMDEMLIEQAVTSKTKAIVCVHYAGVACDMDVICAVAQKHDLFVVEDAAQGIDSFYTGNQGKRALGSIGHFGTFSFHETKNIQCGEGGALLINDSEFQKRSEIIWEKGTNRAAFWRGEIDKYGWVDIGSSFLPSEIVAAFLYAQLESAEKIQERRKQIWKRYNEGLADLIKSGSVDGPTVPSYATNNAHMFYLVCRSEEQRSGLIERLKMKGIHAVFHYQSLHKARYFEGKYKGQALVRSDRYSECLVRLPLHIHLTDQDVDRVIEHVKGFYQVA